mmetsp:Transcript_11650/g.18279  ORF Transcript_11650/g.18279 Transcript_11650/m.18279 type:complete len:297 (-) Transcript_11650:222-1112(-)
MDEVLLKINRISNFPWERMERFLETMEAKHTPAFRQRAWRNSVPDSTALHGAGERAMHSSFSQPIKHERQIAVPPNYSQSMSNVTTIGDRQFSEPIARLASNPRPINEEEIVPFTKTESAPESKTPSSLGGPGASAFDSNAINSLGTVGSAAVFRVPLSTTDASPHGEGAQPRNNVPVTMTSSPNPAHARQDGSQPSIQATMGYLPEPCEAAPGETKRQRSVGELTSPSAGWKQPGRQPEGQLPQVRVVQGNGVAAPVPSAEMGDVGEDETSSDDSQLVQIPSQVAGLQELPDGYA